MEVGKLEVRLGRLDLVERRLHEGQVVGVEGGHLAPAVLGRRHRLAAQEQVEEALVLGLVGQDLLGLLPGGQARLDVVLLLAGVVEPQDGGGIAQVLVGRLLLLDQPVQDRQVVLDLLGLARA